MFTSNLDTKNEAIIGGIEMPRVSTAVQDAVTGLNLALTTGCEITYPPGC